jgi:hypothetical protein
MSAPKQRSFGNMLAQAISSLAHANYACPKNVLLEICFPWARSFIVRELEKLYLFHKIVHRLGQVNGALNYGKHTF